MKKYKHILLNNFSRNQIKILNEIKNIKFVTNFKNKKDRINAIISLKRQSFFKFIALNNLDKFKNLKWVHIPFSGTESFNFLKNFKKINFTSINFIQSTQVAEHAISMLLSISRKISYLAKFGMQSKFDFRPIEIKNKKILIFGYGAIGQEIEKKLKGFNVEINVLTKKKSKKKFKNKNYDLNDMKKAFSENDIIFITIPLNENTKSIISAKELNSLKKNAILICISRENIFDLKSLKKFINKKENQNISFGLDYFSNDFLKRNNFLKKKKNVLLTPHIAGISDSFEERHIQFIINNIKNFRNNKKLINTIFK